MDQVPRRVSKRCSPTVMRRTRLLPCAMSFEDDLRRIEGHIADARRLVHRQKGLVIRLRAAGVSTLDAQRVLWLLETNLKRLEDDRDWLTERLK
jgi:hypothetical protein